MDGKLPPLPSSDSESLARNAFDPYFRIGARDFWKGNHTERIVLKEAEKCEHYFVYTDNGVECKKCRIGWVGKELEAREGKIYLKNEPIRF